MIALNTQPVSKPHYREGGLLEVVDVWYTLQGEGPFAGTPAVFVRLGGCNLQCNFCDTLYTGSELYSPLEIASWVGDLLRDKPRKQKRLVVLTGGEPFRQAIGPLVRLLTQNSFHVQIETNGTLYVEDFPWAAVGLTVVCSPKRPSIHPDMLDKIDYFKYVLEANSVDPVDGLPTSVLGSPIIPFRPLEQFPLDHIFINPVDAGDEHMNKANLNACVVSCMKHGYRLGIQLHKLAGVP